jgi:hypothetical protein
VQPTGKAPGGVLAPCPSKGKAPALFAPGLSLRSLLGYASNANIRGTLGPTDLPSLKLLNATASDPRRTAGPELVPARGDHLSARSVLNDRRPDSLALVPWATALPAGKPQALAYPWSEAKRMDVAQPRASYPAPDSAQVGQCADTRGGSVAVTRIGHIPSMSGDHWRPHMLHLNSRRTDSGTTEMCCSALTDG